MPGGRPLKFNSPGEMQALIDVYFERCEEKEEPPTVTGLCKALDCDKQTLLNYAKKDEFFDTIKRAKLEVEHYLELCLYRPQTVTGIIFNLKNNFGWKDNLGVEPIGGRDGQGPKKITIEFVGDDGSITEEI